MSYQLLQGEEWPLSRGAKNYLLQATNTNAGTITFNHSLLWYERPH